MRQRAWYGVRRGASAPRRMGRLCMLLVLPLAIVALGCSSKTSTACGVGDCKRAQVLHYALVVGGGGGSDAAMLDPNRADDMATRMVTSLLYDGLVTFDARLEMENWGADRIEVSRDGLTYTFHLRAHQAFSDGTPVTAVDYAFSLNRELDPCVAAPDAHLLFAIAQAARFAGEGCAGGQVKAGQSGGGIATLLGQSLRALDPQTLVVTLAEPDGAFLGALAAADAGALDPTLVGGDGASEQWTAGLAQGTSGRGASGIYYVARWDAARNALVLKENPYWWGQMWAKKPYLSEIDFTVFASADTAYAAYQHDDAYAVGLPTTTAQIVAARTQPDFRAVRSLVDRVLVFKASGPPFDNVDARQAFCLAINRDALLDDATRATLLPSWNMVGLGMPGFQPALTGPDSVANIDGDASRAAAHWNAYVARGGHSPISALKYVYDSSDSGAAAQAQGLGTAWSQSLGQQVTLRGESHATWLADVDSGAYDIAQLVIAPEFPDPQQVLSRVFLPTGASTQTQAIADVPEADALLRQADVTGDQLERLALYQKAERLLISNAVVCPLFVQMLTYQVRTNVHNWQPAANGLVPLDAWIATYVVVTPGT